MTGLGFSQDTEMIGSYHQRWMDIFTSFAKYHA